jgi:ubiquitin-like modifier-activating enzyme ATG7
MLKRAFDETGYLEKLTGLDKLQKESERRMRELEEMDEGSEEDDF